MINPAIPNFGLHSHIYDAANIPTNAVITFGFTEPAVVDSLNVVQHSNGVTRVEGFVGNTLNSMTSIGNIFGPLGDVTGGNSFAERSDYLFDFDNAIPGLFYRFVVTKTTLNNGYATYNVNPRDASGQAFGPAIVPEPSTAVFGAVGVLGLGLRRNRRPQRSATRG
jgi:MYXO-CTERM domain-containing protein